MSKDTKSLFDEVQKSPNARQPPSQQPLSFNGCCGKFAELSTIFTILAQQIVRQHPHTVTYKLTELFSFKGQTEFNLFPSSRTTQLTGHIIQQDYAKALRISAIYGANGAGKSNLVKAVSLIRRMVVAGTVDSISPIYYKMPFLLDKQLRQSPVSAALEFSHDGVIYYYTLSFSRSGVELEELYISKKSSDVGQHIEFCSDFF